MLWPLSLVSDSVAAVILSPLTVMTSAAAAVLLKWFAGQLGIPLRWQELAALVARVPWTPINFSR